MCILMASMINVVWIILKYSKMRKQMTKYVTCGKRVNLTSILFLKDLIANFFAENSCSTFWNF